MYLADREISKSLRAVHPTLIETREVLARSCILKVQFDRARLRNQKIGSQNFRFREIENLKKQIFAIGKFLIWQNLFFARHRSCPSRMSVAYLTHSAPLRLPRPHPNMGHAYHQRHPVRPYRFS